MNIIPRRFLSDKDMADGPVAGVNIEHAQAHGTFIMFFKSCVYLRAAFGAKIPGFAG
jgi:hypothetical protein